LTIASFIEDIGKIIVFLMMLLSVFLVTSKSSKKVSNYIFAVFILITAIDFTGLFLGNFRNSSFLNLKIGSVLLQMPLYYLYVQSVCYLNFKLSAKHLWHALLFVIFIGIFSINTITETTFLLYEIVSSLQYYYYITAVFITLYKFKKLYIENYAANHKMMYKWLFQTTILFLIGNTFVKIRTFIPSDNNNSNALLVINLMITTFALSVISWFVLKALYQPRLFLGIDKEILPVKPVKISTKQGVENLEKMTVFMQTEKPYLNPEISLQKLALALGFSDKQLSQVMNQYTGKHFFDYVNEYRIKDAKELLKNKELTVLEVLYDVGFNSKSSFYTAFKKETNQTPTSYRKSIG